MRLKQQNKTESIMTQQQNNNTKTMKKSDTEYYEMFSKELKERSDENIMKFWNLAQQLDANDSVMYMVIIQELMNRPHLMLKIVTEKISNQNK